MLLAGVRNWFGGSKAPPETVRRGAVKAARAADIPSPAYERPGAVWPAMVNPLLADTAE